MCTWKELLVFGAAHVTNNEGRTIESFIFVSQNLFSPFWTTLSPSGSPGGCWSLSQLHILLYTVCIWGLGSLLKGTLAPPPATITPSMFCPHRDLKRDYDHLNLETFVGLTYTSQCSGQVELNKSSRAPMEMLA